MQQIISKTGEIAILRVHSSETFVVSVLCPSDEQLQQVVASNSDLGPWNVGGDAAFVFILKAYCFIIS